MFKAASIPEAQNELKRNQLRELAALNGTLRDDENQACQNCKFTCLCFLVDALLFPCRCIVASLSMHCCFPVDALLFPCRCTVVPIVAY